jgi:hypothetical protein
MPLRCYTYPKGSAHAVHSLTPRTIHHPPSTIHHPPSTIHHTIPYRRRPCRALASRGGGAVRHGATGGQIARGCSRGILRSAGRGSTGGSRLDTPPLLPALHPPLPSRSLFPPLLIHPSPDPPLSSTSFNHPTHLLPLPPPTSPTHRPQVTPPVARASRWTRWDSAWRWQPCRGQYTKRNSPRNSPRSMLSACKQISTTGVCTMCCMEIF